MCNLETPNTECVEVCMDLFVNLVGGASQEELKRKVLEKEPDHIKSIIQIKQLYNDNDRYRYYGTEKFALEVLYIKLIIFLELLKQVYTSHLSNEFAHVELGIEKIIILVFPAKKRLPAFWNISVKLLNSISQPHGQGQTKGIKSNYLSLDFNILGRILIRSLVVNDWNSAAETDEQTDRIISVIEEMKVEKMMASEKVRNLILEEIGRSKEIFESTNILYQGADRSKKHQVIPEEIWDEIIILALGLLSTKGHSADSNHFSLNGLIKRVEEISTIVKIELLQGQHQKQELINFLNEYLRNGN